MSDKLVEVYGRGWAFPPVFSEDGVVMAEGVDDVSQSLNILFKTQAGERILHEDFGCDLNRFIFSNISNALLSDIERQIYDSVLRYEPRADIMNIKFDTSKVTYGELTIQVNYRLCGSDFNYQFSKYLDMANGGYR